MQEKQHCGSAHTGEHAGPAARCGADEEVMEQEGSFPRGLSNVIRRDAPVKYVKDALGKLAWARQQVAGIQLHISHAACPSGADEVCEITKSRPSQVQQPFHSCLLRHHMKSCLYVDIMQL